MSNSVLTKICLNEGDAIEICDAGALAGYVIKFGGSWDAWKSALILGRAHLEFLGTFQNCDLAVEAVLSCG